MPVRILTTSRSPGISDGLTYSSGKYEVKPGSVVNVPLRKKTVEGIVLEVLKKNNTDTFSLKNISDVLSNTPLLSPAHLKTMQWMSEYYCCSVRAAARVFLPSPPWKKLCMENDSVPIRTTRVTKGSTLSGEQRIALEEILDEKKPTLLFGITGSGKTEVYAHVVADVLSHGKQVIVLVPEILLTEQIIQRFSRMLRAEKIAVLHSKLTPAERREEWKRIHRGEVMLVIGSRSALFAPVKSLGLIIIDEEHEWTYKNEQTPRYHARETAEKLCALSNAKLLLGTATPSVESWQRVKDNRYHCVKLQERYKGASLPTVVIRDLSDVSFGEYYPFSPSLLEAIEERMKKKEQCVLFLNRRGHSTALLCLDCRRRVVCPDSNLPYTVHKGRDGKSFLMDHATGMKANLPQECPHCQSVRLRDIGAGTQRIEILLQKLLPQARVVRADRDTLMDPKEMKGILRAMQEGKADVLVGTQSVVKGLDLPNVTLAVVLLADIGLSLPHFRAGERIFQLISQLVGRSGRAKPGEVIVQTFRPEAPEIVLAAEHMTETYLEQELKLRRTLRYPPYTHMIRLIFRGPHSQKNAQDLYRKIEGRVSLKDDYRVSCSPTLFGGGKVWHIFVRGSNPRTLIQDLNLDDAVVDIDPLDCV